MRPFTVERAIGRAFSQRKREARTAEIEAGAASAVSGAVQDRIGEDALATLRAIARDVFARIREAETPLDAATFYASIARQALPSNTSARDAAEALFKPKGRGA